MLTWKAAHAHARALTHTHTLPRQQQEDNPADNDLRRAEWSLFLSVSLSNSCTYSFLLSVSDRF